MTACLAPRHLGDPEPAEAAPHAALCRPCTARLRSDLRRLPSLYADLGALLDPRRAGGPGTGDGGGLPYHVPAAECRDQIAHDAGYWVMRVTEERQPGICPVRTLPSMCGWLAGQVTWVSFRPWAGDMAGAVASDRGRALAVLDPVPVSRFPLPAACPKCGARLLEVTVYTDPGDSRWSMVTCGGCGHEWDTTQWLRLGREILGRAALWYVPCCWTCSAARAARPRATAGRDST